MSLQVHHCKATCKAYSTVWYRVGFNVPASAGAALAHVVAGCLAKYQHTMP